MYLAGSSLARKARRVGPRLNNPFRWYYRQRIWPESILVIFLEFFADE